MCCRHERCPHINRFLFFFAEFNIVDDFWWNILHTTCNNLKQLAEELINKLCNWFCANKLTLNLDKSNFSIFHPPRKKISNEFNTLNVGGLLLKGYIKWNTLAHI